MRTSGFSFYNETFAFPQKSYVQFDPFQGANGFFTESEERFNLTRQKLGWVLKNLTLNDSHSLTWTNKTDSDIMVFVPMFPNVKCATVAETYKKFLTSVNKTSKDIKYDINMNEYQLTFNPGSFAYDAGNNCNVNMVVGLINATGPLAYNDFDDVILIGNQFFNNYQGLHFNFDTKKLAFMPYPSTGSDDDNHVNPSDGGNKSSALMIILIVVGVVAVIGGIAFCVMSRKKLNKDLETYDKL